MKKKSYEKKMLVCEINRLYEYKNKDCVYVIVQKKYLYYYKAASRKTNVHLQEVLISSETYLESRQNIDQFLVKDKRGKIH